MTPKIFVKPIKGSSLKEKIIKNIPNYVLLAPFMLLFTIFMLIPVLSSIIISLTDFNMVQSPNFVGIDNYLHLFLDDEVFVKAIQNTLVFAVITGPVGFLLSFVVAWLVNELGRHTRSFVTFIMYAPSLTANVFVIWIFIFSGDAKGFLNNLLLKIGLIRDPEAWLSSGKYSFSAVVIVIIWLSLGAGFLSLVAGLQTLDRAYYEAGVIDGINNRWQELYYITLPQMGPQLLFSAIMSISGAFAVGNVPMALTGFPSTNYSTHTLLLHMQDYAVNRYEMGYSSAIAVVLFIIMVITWYAINRALRRFTAI